MIYLTQRRLMVESETTIRHGCTNGDSIPRRVCGQLIADAARYLYWQGWHGIRMLNVAQRKRRDRQIVTLRAVHLEQIHRTALVRYLRKHEITGTSRDDTLQEFHGVVDPRRAAVNEHKTYLISASSQLCIHDLLKLVGDHRGLALIQDYQGTFEQYFGMFCENTRAIRNGAPYILRELIPDARTEAETLRLRILAGDLLPSAPVAIKVGRAPWARHGYERTIGVK